MWTDVGSTEQSNKIGFVKFNAGQPVVVRFVDEDLVTRWTHWDNVKRRSFTCLGEGCPACEMNAQMKEAGLPKNKWRFSNSKKHTMHIINRDTNQLQLLEQSDGFFKTIKTLIENGYADPTGYDMKVIRQGTGTDTSYSFIPAPPSPLSPSDEALLVDKQDLRDKLKAMSIEGVRELIGLDAPTPGTDGQPEQSSDGLAVDFNQG